MSGDHDHGDMQNTPVSRLWMALGLTGAFMVAEVIGGFVTGSLALISDAMHMLTDTMALAIALLAIHVGRRQADLLRTYGYARSRYWPPPSMRCYCSASPSTFSTRLGSDCPSRRTSPRWACWGLRSSALPSTSCRCSS